MEYKFITYDRNTDAVPDIVNGQHILEMDDGHPVGMWIDQYDHRYPAMIAGGKVQPYFAGHEMATDKLILGNNSVGSAPPEDPKTGQMFFQISPPASQLQKDIFVVSLNMGDYTASADPKEIAAARAAGKIVVARNTYNGRDYLCSYASPNYAQFFAADINFISLVTVQSDKTWKIEAFNYLWPTGESWSGHGWRNGTVRGNTITPDANFYSEIERGSFDNIFLGDTVKLGKHYYLVAGFNTYPSIYKSLNHLVLVSRDAIGSGMMSENSRADLGYGNSDYFQNVKDSILQELLDEGHHVHEYIGKLVIGTIDGAPSEAVYGRFSVELLSETQVFGQKLLGPQAQTASAKDLMDFCQLPLFRLDPAWIGLRFGAGPYWLRDAASNSEFVAVGTDGLPIAADAAQELNYRVMLILHGYEE